MTPSERLARFSDHAHKPDGSGWVWGSICSRHHDFNESCGLCSKGSWVNTESSHERFSAFLWWASPFLWRLWANRKRSPERERVESLFPKMRGKHDC